MRRSVVHLHADYDRLDPSVLVDAAVLLGEPVVFHVSRPDMDGIDVFEVGRFTGIGGPSTNRHFWVKECGCP